jgi:hypothetical protein
MSTPLPDLKKYLMQFNDEDAKPVSYYAVEDIKLKGGTILPKGELTKTQNMLLSSDEVEELIKQRKLKIISKEIYNYD